MSKDNRTTGRFQKSDGDFVEEKKSWLCSKEAILASIVIIAVIVGVIIVGWNINPDSVDMVKDYCTAISSGNTKAAYAEFSSRDKEEMSYEEFSEIGVISKREEKDASSFFILGGCMFILFGAIFSLPSIKRLKRLRYYTKMHYKFWLRCDEATAERRVNFSWLYLILGFGFGLPLLIGGLSMI